MDLTSAATGAPSPEEALRANGFLFAPRPVALGLIGSDVGADWEPFAATWDDLGIDSHMADRGRYRRRRHGVFSATREAGLQRAADAPHYQALDHNRLNGGIDRRFEPMTEEAAGTEAFRSLSDYGLELFGRLRPDVRRWQVEAHQFRIVAKADAAGQPTPEGVHRDGVDFVLVALIRRENIVSGTTTIHQPDGKELGSFTLTEPLDLALLDDHRVWHGVTAVEPLDAARPAWRDVLVLTFRTRVG